MLIALPAAALEKVPFDLSAPGWNIFILLFFIGAVVLYGFVLGRERMMAILVSLYIGIGITESVPYLAGKEAAKLAKQLGFPSANMMRLAVFLVVMIVAFLLLSRTGVFRNARGRGWALGFMTASMLQVGLLISEVLFLLPVDTQKTLAEPIRTLFLSDVGRTSWLILPLVGLFFLRDD